MKAPVFPGLSSFCGEELRPTRRRAATNVATVVAHTLARRGGGGSGWECDCERRSQRVRRAQQDLAAGSRIEVRAPRVADAVGLRLAAQDLLVGASIAEQVERGRAGGFRDA